MQNDSTIMQQNTGHYFLYPSNIFASKTPMNIQTLLGSCVAVCLYDQRLKIGGMNHYMIAMWNDSGLASPKYGNIAIDNLIERMMALGSKKRDLTAKIFGGASQYDHGNKLLAIGERNIQIAESILQGQGIPIVAKSLGGEQGRKIIFNTSTGQVMMKFIEKQKKEC
jgi:chemotaxis protein CheD